MASVVANSAHRIPPADDARAGALNLHERQGALNYPLSRFLLRPLAGRLAAALASTIVRPWHLSLFGVAAAGAAAGVLLAEPSYSPLAALLVLTAWFFDRADGQLARRQQTVSPLGAWLDANFDEFVDLGLHVAVAASAASSGSTWAWPSLVAFLAGKYLLMYGLLVETPVDSGDSNQKTEISNLKSQISNLKSQNTDCKLQIAAFNSRLHWHGLKRPLHAAYHLPANADIRVHLLALALLSGWLTAELAFVAVYYNLRWLARYPLMARKLRGAAP